MGFQIKTTWRSNMVKFFVANFEWIRKSSKYVRGLLLIIALMFVCGIYKHKGAALFVLLQICVFLIVALIFIDEISWLLNFVVGTKNYQKLLKYFQWIWSSYGQVSGEFLKSFLYAIFWLSNACDMGPYMRLCFRTHIKKKKCLSLMGPGFIIIIIFIFLEF